MSPEVQATIDRAVAAARARVPDSATLIGVGWATVDLDRAAAELGITPSDVAPDDALGARCRAIDGPDGVAFVLLEPSTDGRLAATLARWDEGPAITWWDVPAVDGRAAAPETSGPLGAVRLLRDGGRDGPWRFLRVRSPVTISP